MGKYKLNADVRTDTGKEKAKKLRAAGKFPAIVYGADAGPVSLTLDIRDTENILSRIHGEKVLVDLEYGDRKDKVFVRNVQRDPVIEKLLHVDFFRVDPTREIATKIPVVAIGTAAGVKLGGLLEHGLREVEIRCLPTKVPPHLEVNVEALETGQSFHISQLPQIEGVKYLSSPETVLFAVVGKQKEEPVAAGAPEAAPTAPAPAKK